MNPDCYEFYLWSIGALRLSPKRAFELISENQLEPQERNETL